MDFYKIKFIFFFAFHKNVDILFHFFGVKRSYLQVFFFSFPILTCQWNPSFATEANRFYHLLE